MLIQELTSNDDKEPTEQKPGAEHSRRQSQWQSLLLARDGGRGGIKCGACEKRDLRSWERSQGLALTLPVWILIQEQEEAIVIG